MTLLMDRRSSLGRAAVLVTALAAISGCAGGSGDPGAAPGAGDRPAPAASAQRAGEPVAPARCPAGLPSCRTATGRIAYREEVDPDGDGDAHFVILDPQGITLPGLTAIDVRRGLRPDPLPGFGELISAAGPVQTGSYGQSQIHALELHVADR
jgi:hypothetical protein